MIKNAAQFLDIILRILHYLKNRTIFFLVVLLLPFGCENKEESARFVNDSPFYLKVEEVINISDSLFFSINKVQDSRCPMGVECFWAGDVNLFFNIRQNSNSIDTMICQYSCHRNPFIIGGYTWKVLEVNPYPDFHKKIYLKDIRIKMIITENWHYKIPLAGLIFISWQDKNMKNNTYSVSWGNLLPAARDKLSRYLPARLYLPDWMGQKSTWGFRFWSRQWITKS